MKRAVQLEQPFFLFYKNFIVLSRAIPLEPFISSSFCFTGYSDKKYSKSLKFGNFFNELIVFEKLWPTSHTSVFTKDAA